jgi:hypothetical protein
MVCMEDLLYCQPLSPVVRQYLSESLLSLFYTALRWSYDERNSFGAQEHLRTDPAPGSAYTYTSSSATLPWRESAPGFFYPQSISFEGIKSL